MTKTSSADKKEITQAVQIPNSLGLHARPAMMLVDLANRYRSELSITKDQQTVDAKSIMQIMTLAATRGTRLTLKARGPDAAEALGALAKLIAEGFNEE